MEPPMKEQMCDKKNHLEDKPDMKLQFLPEVLLLEILSNLESDVLMRICGLIPSAIPLCFGLKKHFDRVKIHDNAVIIYPSRESRLEATWTPEQAHYILNGCTIRALDYNMDYGGQLNIKGVEDLFIHGARQSIEATHRAAALVQQWRPNTVFHDDANMYQAPSRGFEKNAEGIIGNPPAARYAAYEDVDGQMVEGLYSKGFISYLRNEFSKGKDSRLYQLPVTIQQTMDSQNSAQRLIREYLRADEENKGRDQKEQLDRYRRSYRIAKDNIITSIRRFYQGNAYPLLSNDDADKAPELVESPAELALVCYDIQKEAGKSEDQAIRACRKEKKAVLLRLVCNSSKVCDDKVITYWTIGNS
ncbi:unnamed protein product, partial [Mesorhabditis spiculigera]